MPDERKCRRPDWCEGTIIRLEDGQDWSFPRPTREFRIRNGGLSPGLATAETNRRFGPRFWSLQKAMAEAVRRDVDGIEGPDRDAAIVAQYQSIADVAADLLARNYELSEDELVELLPIIEDAENMAIWGAIADHALGIAPKPPTAGNA